MDEFAATVRRSGRAAVVELSGQLDAAAAGVLHTAVEQAVAAHAETVLLAFDEAVYINSTGIALLAGLFGRARAQGLEVRVCGLSEHYRHLFEITRLSDFMRFFPDEQSALGDAQPV